MESEALDQTKDEIKKIVQLLFEIVNEINLKLKTSTHNLKREGQLTC